MKKALIILPTFNERKNLKVLVPQIFEVAKKIAKWDIEILVVDDNSPDGTYEEAVLLSKKFPKKIHILKGQKEGLGKAYVRGFAYAIEHIKPEVMFEMDADGQHDPILIPDFLREIDNGADFVIGSRYVKGGSIPSHWTLDRKFYSIVGNLVAQLGFMHLSIHDWTSGYRAIKADFLKNTVKEMDGYNGYVFQIGLLDKALKGHLHIKEIPQNFIDRNEGESKFSSIEFIIDSILYIFFNSPFVKFIIVGLGGFIVDFGIAATLIHWNGMYKPTANALSAEFAIIFNFLMNNYWSFKHKKVSHRDGSGFIRKFVKFNIVASGSIAIQGIGMYLALSIFGDTLINIFNIHFHSWILYKVFLIAIFIIPYSYFMYNKFIWKSVKN